jgi:CheY-like chemotaxis protein
LATRKLLLADDSVTIQKVVNLTFADEGMEVNSVGDGDSAVEKLEELMPDIVLADVHMPGLNGYQVCEHIKTSSQFGHIPVILLVGSFEPFDEDEARRVGADDYLTKPFQSIRQLVSRVGTLLSQAEEKSIEVGATQPLSRESLPTESQSGVEQPYFESPTAMVELDELETPLPVAQEAAESWTATPQSFEDSAIYDELLEATPVSSPETSEEPTTFSGEIRATTRLSAEDLKGFGFESSPSIPIVAEELPPSSTPQEIGLLETVPIIRHEEIAAAMADASVEKEPAPAQFVAEAATVSVGVGSPYSTSPLSDDSILDLGYIETPPPTFDEEFVLDLESDYREIETLATAPTPSVETSFVPTTEPEEPIALEPSPPATQVEEAAGPIEMPPVEFVQPKQQEIELELPPSLVAETKTAPVAAESVAGTTVTEAAPTTTGPISAGSLSQESIDAIARRVVEMMSERVIQEIAWEVVPELADLHIKRKMLEKGL